ncbi:Na+/H+ antiporter NhaA [Dysgonomonas macrotermitis]|uniref:Na(+)/H(+) antiporter NhaA n=1 Tax=Dysgonomonas macrotermitis TaxID=1346286 RepID=A0A1M5HHC8_9BACT|nr:Na+/H+ antiporter NhaA [Dysgonomonas macrotermitis]SHG15242.1 sodium/proton antiporter, NhaA family [Dysgonomonas macrotermitis]
MKTTRKPFNYSFLSFFRHNVNGGMLLMITAVLAMVIANSAWSEWYTEFWSYPISLQIGSFNLFSHHGAPLTLAAFINDALMAIFFFHVGLEVKREILVGELSSLSKASLPVVAAIGGMVVPVLVYLFIAGDDPGSRGAAIPMATDIAFSLGVLSLLGSRVPMSLKIFLMAFAVVDDIGGILVIAIFYSSHLDVTYLAAAMGLFLVLCVANYKNVSSIALYVLIGIGIWYLFLQSGVHSTIAGVLVAFSIPARPKLRIGKYIDRIRTSIDAFPRDMDSDQILSKDQISELKNIEAASNKVISPLQFIEDRLHGVVNYFIMPVFAFVNAGIVFEGNLLDSLGPVTYAVLAGLVLGKFVGIFAFTWIAVSFKFVALPDGCRWKEILGVSFLGGIGFTVSLFIANLSFGSAHPDLLNEAKMGIVAGTLVAGILGYLILSRSLPAKGK